jgi:hypothetical protein
VYRFLGFLSGVVVLAAAGCSEPAGATRTCGGVPIESPVIVLSVGQDRASSALGRVDTDGCLTEIPDIALGADPALSMGRDGLFVCARSEGLVLEIDPTLLSIRQSFTAYGAAEKEFTIPCGGVPSAHNPQDVDRDANGNLWITRYEQPTIALVLPSGELGEKVSLSKLADADGLPEAGAVRVVGDRAYVAVQLLDRCGGFVPTGHGRIAVIDVASHDHVSTIELGGENPFGRMVPVPWDKSGGTVAIALPGDFYAIDTDADAAAIVDLPNGEARGIAKESELGGSIAEVALAAPDEGYAIVAHPDPMRLLNPTRVVRVNPETGALGATLLDSRDDGDGGGYYHYGIAVVGAHVLVSDRTPGAAAIHVFERATGREIGLIRPQLMPPAALLTLPL